MIEIKFKKALPSCGIYSWATVVQDGKKRELTSTISEDKKSITIEGLEEEECVVHVAVYELETLHNAKVKYLGNLIGCFHIEKRDGNPVVCGPFNFDAKIAGKEKVIKRLLGTPKVSTEYGHLGNSLCSKIIEESSKFAEFDNFVEKQKSYFHSGSRKPLGDMVRVNPEYVGRTLGKIPRELFYLESHERVSLDFVGFVQIYRSIKRHVMKLWDCNDENKRYKILCATAITSSILTNSLVYTPDKIDGVGFEMFSDQAPLKKSGDCEDMGFMNMGILNKLKRTDFDCVQCDDAVKADLEEIQQELQGYVAGNILVVSTTPSMEHKHQVHLKGNAVTNPLGEGEIKFEKQGKFFHMVCILLPVEYFQGDRKGLNKNPFIVDGTGLIFPELFHPLVDGGNYYPFLSDFFKKVDSNFVSKAPVFVGKSVRNQDDQVYLGAVNIVTDEFCRDEYGNFKEGPVLFDCYSGMDGDIPIGSPHIEFLDYRCEWNSMFNLNPTTEITKEMYNMFRELQKYEPPPKLISPGSELSITHRVDISPKFLRLFETFGYYIVSNITYGEEIAFTEKVEPEKILDGKALLTYNWGNFRIVFAEARYGTIDV